MTRNGWGIAAVIFVFVTLYLFAEPDRPRSDQQFSGRVRHVVDGDSLYLHGMEQQVRLWGINAPERGQTNYQRATRKLRALALHQQILCYLQDTDRYGRAVARCETESGTDIGRQMLESGNAREYCRFSKGFYGGCPSV